MPDDVQSTPAAPSAAPAAPASPGIPEKFAGKSVEDVAKAYLELEGKLGEQGKRLGELDNYSKIGSYQDITAALDWARTMKTALDQGLLIPKGANAPHAEPAQPGKPWESTDWAYKSPQEQFEAFSEMSKKEAKAYIDSIAAEYGKQIQGLSAQDGRQKAILLRAIKTAIKNPDTDPEELLAEAAGLGSKTPEELIEMVMEARGNSPAARKAEIDRMVAEQVALKLQEKEAASLAEITSAATPKPRLGQRQWSREEENKQILSKLKDLGTKLI